MGARIAIRRLLSLWRFYGTMDLLWMARDLGTLLTFLVSDLIGATGAITATLLLAARFGGIGQWSTTQMVFMLGYALLACGAPDILFNYNVAYISRRIGRGQLDHSLLQPMPLWMALLTDGFSPFSTLMELVPGTTLLIWAVAHGAVPSAPLWPLALLLNLAASVSIVVAFSFLWGSVAFWAPRAAEELNSASWSLITGLTPFPLDGVGAGLITALLTAVPAGFLAWYPARSLLRLDHADHAWLVTPLVAVAFLVITTLVFQKGLRHYEHTGSARYLSLGHRR